MKKVFIVLISILLLTGCGKKNKEVLEHKEIVKEEEFVLKELDSEKDKVYFDTYKSLILNGELYELKIATINLNSQDVSNVNLEMKSFVGNSYNNLSLDDRVILAGNIIDYEVIEYNDYLVVKQNYYFYYENSKMSDNSNIYVIDYSTGKLLSNDDLLSKYELSEENMFKSLEKKVKSKDADLVIANIKNEGYKLFINKDGKLMIYYVEINDDGQIKKELSLT